MTCAVPAGQGCCAWPSTTTRLACRQRLRASRRARLSIGFRCSWHSFGQVELKFRPRWRRRVVRAEPSLMSSTRSVTGNNHVRADGLQRLAGTQLERVQQPPPKRVPGQQCTQQCTRQHRAQRAEVAGPGMGLQARDGGVSETGTQVDAGQHLAGGGGKVTPQAQRRLSAQTVLSRYSRSARKRRASTASSSPAWVAAICTWVWVWCWRDSKYEAASSTHTTSPRASRSLLGPIRVGLLTTTPAARPAGRNHTVSGHPL